MPAAQAVFTIYPGCPVCAETECADPAECLYFLTSRPWADCYQCDGFGLPRGFQAESFCETCAGSGLMEHSVDSIAPDEISQDAKIRHGHRVAILRARLASAPAAVAVAA